MDIARVHIEKVIKAQQRCFLCTLEEECEKRYMEAYLAEYVMSPSSRDELVSSGGFCNHHSYVMLKVAVNPENADGHGIALTIKSIAEKFAEDLQKLKKKNLKRRGENVLDAQKCPACVHILRLMESYAEKTVQLLSSDHDFAKLYQASPGLCMPHFTWLVRKTTPLTPFCQQTCISVLVETQLKSLEKLRVEMSEYIRKQGYETSAEDRVALAKVPFKAIEKVAGRRGIICTEDQGRVWLNRA